MQNKMSALNNLLFMARNGWLTKDELITALDGWKLSIIQMHVDCSTSKFMESQIKDLEGYRKAEERYALTELGLMLAKFIRTTSYEDFDLLRTRREIYVLNDGGLNGKQD